MKIERENTKRPQPISANRLNNCQQYVQTTKNVDEQHFRVFKMNPLVAESESDSDARKSTPNFVNNEPAVALGIISPRYDTTSKRPSCSSVSILYAPLNPNWLLLSAPNCVEYYSPTSSPASSTSHTVVQNIFLSFSWRRNFRILFSDLPHHCIADVTDISGLRLLSMSWMLLVHVCTVIYYVAGELEMESENILRYSNSYRFQITKSTKINLTHSIYYKRYLTAVRSRSIHISFCGECASPKIILIRSLKASENAFHLFGLAVSAWPTCS